MQVLFPKHVWRHTECMPTSHWRTGASHISLPVITVAWWISSKQITDPLPTSLSHYCCYLSCSAAATTVATAVTYLALLLLLLLLSLATVATCYCCHYCCSLPLLLLVTLLLPATILVRWSLTGTDNFRQRGNLAPLIQSLGIVCRQQIVSDTVVIILLCCYYFACRY